MASDRWSSVHSNDSKWRRQRARILARDEYRCRIQGPKCLGKATEVDHLVPWVPGETVADHALQAACKPCNSAAGSPEKRNPPVPTPGWL